MSPKDEMVQRLVLASIGVTPAAFQMWSDNNEATHPTLVADGQDGAAPGEILIYGMIVPHDMARIYQSWFGDDSVMSGKMFREALSAISGDVLIRFNSPGGHVWEASTIVQAIDERGSEVKGIVDGVAASAASLIMAACEDVTMARMANVMIHQGWSCDCGTGDELRATADMLDSIDAQAAKLYSDRMPDTSKDEVMALMAKETWFSADEAVEAGLADRVFVKDDDGEGGDEGAMALASAASSYRFHALLATGAI